MLDEFLHGPTPTLAQTIIDSLFLLLLLQDLIHMEDYLVEGYKNGLTEHEAEEDDGWTQVNRYKSQIKKNVSLIFE